MDSSTIELRPSGIKCRTFPQRMWRAVAFIESGAQHSRQLDEAFESHDGDAMCAALWTLAASRPKLHANIRQYVCEPRDGRGKELVGKPMAEIRKAAREQRRQGWEAFGWSDWPRY